VKISEEDQLKAKEEKEREEMKQLVLQDPKEALRKAQI